uniref:Uncharacterized protein n=2 Tax=Salix viminalis TaxID=40686 RepID=A0A6N2MFK7_SALVM
MITGVVPFRFQTQWFFSSPLRKTVEPPILLKVLFHGADKQRQRVNVADHFDARDSSSSHPFPQNLNWMGGLVMAGR